MENWKILPTKKRNKKGRVNCRVTNQNYRKHQAICACLLICKMCGKILYIATSKKTQLDCDGLISQDSPVCYKIQDKCLPRSMRLISIKQALIHPIWDCSIRRMSFALGNNSIKKMHDAARRQGNIFLQSNVLYFLDSYLGGHHSTRQQLQSRHNGQQL